MTKMADTIATPDANTPTTRQGSAKCEIAESGILAIYEPPKATAAMMTEVTHTNVGKSSPFFGLLLTPAPPSPPAPPSTTRRPEMPHQPTRTGQRPLSRPID